MHDAEKLRRYLLSYGAYITRDYTFEDKKFYEVIEGGYDGVRTERYSDAEYEFGRDNLRERGDAFLQRMEILHEKLGDYMQREGLSEESKTELEERRKRLQGVLRGEIK
jgi:tRNA A22 N-methylase